MGQTALPTCNIHGVDILVKEWGGERYLISKDIGQIHGYSSTAALAAFHQRKDTVFKENVDYVHIPGTSVYSLFGINSSKGLYLLSYDVYLHIIQQWNQPDLAQEYYAGKGNVLYQPMEDEEQETLEDILKETEEVLPVVQEPVSVQETDALRQAFNLFGMLIDKTEQHDQQLLSLETENKELKERLDKVEAKQNEIQPMGQMTLNPPKKPRQKKKAPTVSKLQGLGEAGKTRRRLQKKIYAYVEEKGISYTDAWKEINAFVHEEWGINLEVRRSNSGLTRPAILEELGLIRDLTEEINLWVMEEREAKKKQKKRSSDRT